MPRRRRSAKPPKLGKESWQIVHEGGAILREYPYGEGATLAVAQQLAQSYNETTTLTVRLKPLFGDYDELYRVHRDEDGNILTLPVGYSTPTGAVR